MNWPKLYPLVFSEKSNYRIARHSIFWFGSFTYHLLRIGLMYPPGNILGILPSLLEMVVYWGIIMNMIFSYTVVYYLVPKFFNKKKYFRFSLGLLAILAFIQVSGTLHSLLFVNPTFQKNALNVSQERVILGILPGFIRLFGNPPLICCLLLSLKMLKNWYLKQKENTLLLHENTLIELQLLKAQVHPHFLFNTLNNIYSFTLNQKPGAGDLLRKLSGMLHYMIHECQSSLVPLEKEIKLIEDYIGLEKVRYGKRLSLQVVMQGDFKDKMIAPLLIIPFIENSFKHGTSNMLQDPWLKLELNVHDRNLFFELSNSKPAGDSRITEGGIGLNNVRKRLGLIYPDEHELRIESSENSYKINMQIPVHSKITMSPAEWDQKSLLQTKHAIHAG